MSARRSISLLVAIAGVAAALALVGSSGDRGRVAAQEAAQEASGENDDGDDPSGEDGEEVEGAEGAGRPLGAQDEPPEGADAATLDRWLAGRIDALIAERPGLEGARVGIHVERVDDGEALYSKNGDQPFSVASCAKLLTAAAALALLGPDFRPRTAVLAEEVDPAGVVTGDLYLAGRGDPGLSITDLANLADDLVNHGITGVRGKLVVDDTYFDDRALPPHFDEQPEEQASFRAPASALSVSFNAYSVLIRPAPGGTGPALITVDVPGDHVRIAANTLITQASGRNRIRMTSAIERDHIEVSLKGQIRADTPLRRFRRRIDDPTHFVHAVFRALLADRGIKIRNRVVREQTPDEAVPLAWIDGAPVAVQVRGLGKYSNNFVAEMLLKIIGAEARQGEGPGTWQDGLEAVRGFVAELGLEPGSYRYDNGSGLFDATAIAPAQLVRVLAEAARNPRWGPDFVAALSIAGVDGTLRRRMEGSPAYGVVRAKTGTLARVSALSGYAAVDRLDPLAFSVVVDGMPDKGRAGRAAKRDARDLQDRVADTLVVYARARQQAARTPPGARP